MYILSFNWARKKESQKMIFGALWFLPGILCGGAAHRSSKHSSSSGSQFEPFAFEFADKII